MPNTQRMFPFFVVQEGDDFKSYQDAMRLYRETLVNKWRWLLEEDEERGVKAIPKHLWESMAVIFENQEAASRGLLTEATTTGDIAMPIRFALPIVRKVFPNLIATKICAIQPMPLMSGGVAQVFYQDFEREDAGDTSLTELDSDYALSSENAIPKRIKMTMTSETVTAIKDMLAATWSTEVQEDAGGSLGINVPGELINACAEEIMREIDNRVINEILNGAAAGNTLWSRTVPAGYTAQEWYETLYHAVVDADDLIYGNRYRETEWIVAGRNVYKYLLKAGDFKPDPRRAGPDQRLDRVGVQFEGVFYGHWDIYRTVMINSDKAIVGVYPRSQTDTGYVYMPYIPVTLMPLVYASFDPTTGVYKNVDKWTRNVRTRYGKKMVVPELYATISVVT